MNLKYPVKGFILSLFFLLVVAVTPSFGRVKFIQNKGQWNKLIQYAADIPGGRVFLGKQWLRYAFVDDKPMSRLHAYNLLKPKDVNYQSIFIDFVNSSEDVKITSDSAGSEYYNFFTSSNPSKCATHLKPFYKVKYENLFPGISLLVESEDDAIKHTYFVKANADASRIQYKVSGADDLKIVNGELRIIGWLGQIQESKPYAYQEYEGQRKQVACNYVLRNNVIGFEFPDGYNKDLPLVVDPRMIFATYSGSYADNFGFTGTYDKEGDGYSAGTVYFAGFPVKPGKHEYDKTYHGGDSFALVEEGYYAGDVGILKYNKTGDSLLYATYLGGKGYEQPNSMVVDSQDRLIVFGNTSSADFPFSSNAWQKTYNDSCDIFLSKFSRNGDSLIASTFIGGSGPDGLNGVVTWDFGYDFSLAPLFYNYGDQARGEVIVDGKGNVYVASSTMSSDFVDPVKFPKALQNKLRGGQDGCVFKMNADFSKLIYNTLIGGTNADAAYSLQRDSKGNIFVTGGTNSPYFFSDTKAYQNYLKSPFTGSKSTTNNIDAYVCALKDDGQTLLNATYLGTSHYDQAYFVQIDKSDNVYLYGQTSGGDSFPSFNALYNNPKSGQFITEFNHELDTIIRSGTIGKKNSRPDISPTAFLVDDCGKIYISGWGGNVNATFYGGHGGNTSGLPITTDAFQSNTDGSDFYVAVLASKMDTLLYASYFGGDGDDEHVDGGTSRFDKRAVMYQSVCGACGTPGNFPTTTNAWSTDNKGLRRDFDTKSQQYFLDSNSHGCNNLLFKVDLSIPDLKADFDAPTHGCSPFFVTFTNKTLNAKTYLWDFGDGTTSKLRNPLPHKYAFGGIYNVVLTVTNYYSCTVKDSVPIKIQAYYKSKPNFSYEKDTCNHLVSFDTTGTNALAETLFWKFGDNDTASGPAPKHYYKNAGKYKVTLITDKGTPCSDSSSQIITLNKSDFGFALDTCSKTITVNYLYVRDSDFLWIIDGQIFKNKYPTYTFKGSGNQSIKLVIRPKAPCDTITKIVTFPPLKKPVARFVFDTCTRTATITGFTPNDSTPIWIFGKDTLRVKYPSYTFSKSGLDSFTLILPHYCKGDTARLPIYIPPKNKASFTYVNPPCTRDYAFHPLMFDPKYHWDFGDGFTDTLVNPPKHTYISDTTYMVTFIINAGKQCADTAVKFVTPKRKKDAAFSFVIDSCTGEVYFMNKTDTGAKQFLWDFGDQSNRETDRNINHFYSKEGDYTVTLLSEPGTTCADTAKNTFKMEGIGYDHLLIPNVMTPDGDGKNDVFSVSGINDKCIDFQLEIFNRWGQLVYKQYGGPGQILVWDGTSLKGDALAAGVYYWILTGKAIGQKEGTVTLVR